MRTIWGEGYGGEATRWNDLSCGCIKSWIDREISMPKCHYPSTGLPLYQPHKHTNNGKLLTKPDGLYIYHIPNAQTQHINKGIAATPTSITTSFQHGTQTLLHKGLFFERPTNPAHHQRNSSNTNINHNLSIRIMAVLTIGGSKGVPGTSQGPVHLQTQ